MGDPLTVKYGKQAKAGEILFREGEPGDEMFVIRSGSVRVYVEANGIEKTLAILGAGEFLGEMSLLSTSQRTATAIVVEDADLLVIGAKVLEEMIVHNTEIALRLIRKLVRRLEAADSLVQVLIHRDPRARVIENLKRLAILHGWKPGEEVALKADFDEMADQVGLTVAEVADVTSRLVRAGALVEQDGAWIIKEPGRLGEFLEFLKMKDQFK